LTVSWRISTTTSSTASLSLDFSALFVDLPRCSSRHHIRDLFTNVVVRFDLLLRGFPDGC
jgi:hypothetical protein